MAVEPPPPLLRVVVELLDEVREGTDVCVLGEGVVIGGGDGGVVTDTISGHEDQAGQEGIGKVVGEDPVPVVPGPAEDLTGG